MEDNSMHAISVRKRNRQVGCIIAVVRLSRYPQPRLQAMPASVPKSPRLASMLSPRGGPKPGELAGEPAELR